MNPNWASDEHQSSQFLSLYPSVPVVYNHPHPTATITSQSQYEMQQQNYQSLLFQPQNLSISYAENQKIESSEPCYMQGEIIEKKLQPQFLPSQDLLNPSNGRKAIVIKTEEVITEEEYKTRSRNCMSIARVLRKAANVDEEGIGESEKHKLGPRCESDYCQKSQFLFCPTFTEETRQKIFNEFWYNMNWDQRHIFVSTHVFRKSTPTSASTSEETAKSFTMVYTLRNSNGNGEQVCQTMFLNTIDLKASKVNLWVKKYSIGGDGVSMYKEEFKKQLASIKVIDPKDYDKNGQPKKKRKWKKKTKKKRVLENDDELQDFREIDDDDGAPKREYFDHNFPNKPAREKNTVKPEYWKRNLAKRLRLEGEEYYSKNSKTGEMVLHEGKKLKPTCVSRSCKVSKLRHCSEISEETREKIFNDIWKRWDWSQRKIWVASMAKRKATLRKRTLSIDSRRQTTLHYFLPNDNGIPVQVCRTMFANTTLIGHYQIFLWTTSYSLGSEIEQTITSVKQADHHTNDWLESLPKYSIGKNTTTKFFDPYFKSFNELFKTYTDICQKADVKETQRYQIKRVLRSRNLKIVSQNEEICDMCKNMSKSKFEYVTEETFEHHKVRIEKSTKEKLRDFRKAQAGTAIVLQVHLQPIKTVPILRTEEQHLKYKLLCYNLTINEVKSNFSTCYLFSEDQCSDVDKNIESIFTTILCEHIQKKCTSFKKNLPIIIYSSGELDQTRNIILSNALLNLATTCRLNICQKFFEKGHSLVEDCYKPFQILDRYINCKNKEIYLPSQLAKAMREIKRWPDIFTGLHLDYGFFNNYSLPEHFRYKSIHPGDGFDEKDACEMNYNSNGKIHWKFDFDEEYIELLQKSEKNFKPILEYPKLYNDMALIPKSKWEDLQDLKRFMPFDCQQFYDSLRYFED